MQSFSTKEIRHNFLVDDLPYYLPGVNVGDLEQIAELFEMDVTPQMVAFRELIASRAQSPNRWAFWRKSPRRAVAALTIKQLSELFQAWTGMDKKPGESSASPDSL